MPTLRPVHHHRQNSSSTPSCRFLLYKMALVVIQGIVIPRWVSFTRLLQPVLNTAAHLVLDLSKFSHTLHLQSLLWLPVAARIQFKHLVLTCRAVPGTAPSYVQATAEPYSAAQPPRFSSFGQLAALPLQRSCSPISSARSKILSVLALQWWNGLSTEICLFRQHIDTPCWHFSFLISLNTNQKITYCSR